MNRTVVPNKSMETNRHCLGPLVVEFLGAKSKISYRIQVPKQHKLTLRHLAGIENN